MDKTIDLNDVCVFCYNNVEESVKPRPGEGSQNVNLFCKFLSRICGKKFNVSADASCKLLAACEDCVNNLDSFNELYHQVECLQLQMEWRLDKLKNAMKCADKIPSRVTQFRNRYSIPSEQQRNVGCVDGDECKQLLDTRNVIQIRVSEYLSRAFPRVRVETVRKSRDCDLSLETTLNRSQLQEACVPFNPVNNTLEEDIEDVEGPNTPSNSVHFEPEFPDPTDQPMETNARKRQDDICTNLQVAENAGNASKFENDIPSTSRQLRSKFKCKTCYFTFSTKYKLNEHSQSCTMDCETDDEEENEAMCENDSNSVISSQGSDYNEMAMEEDSDSDDSTDDSDIEPNAETKARKTVCKIKVPTLNLTEAEVQSRIKDILDKAEAKSTISCPDEACSRFFFKQADLTNHFKQHGVFRCNFCPVEKTFAPELALHELEHADSSSVTKWVKFKCSRCPYTNPIKRCYVEHHLRKHLHLSPDYFTVKCPICPKTIKTTIFRNIKISLTTHYLRHHTTGISEPPDRHNNITHKSYKKERGMLVITDDGKTIDDILDESNAKWPCPVASCKFKFFTENDLATHAKFHGSFQCNFCPVTETFAPDLAYHEIREHRTTKSPLLKCSRCEFNSYKIRKCVSHHLKVHLNFPPDTTTISCPVCQQTFKTIVHKTAIGSQGLDKGGIGSLLGHFISHHDKSKVIAPASILNCENCPAYFLTQHQLLLHTKRVHPEQYGIPCADCCQKFQQRYQLRHHRTAVHHDNDDSGYEFVCQVPNCLKRYEYECDLRSHTASHSKPSSSSHTCPECGKVLQNKVIFDKHVKNHEVQVHVCEQCGREFKRKITLKIHMLYHAGPDNWEFMCDICSVKCPTKGNLKVHKQIHSNTKPYICELCGASYVQQNNLRHHMRKKHGAASVTRKHTNAINFGMKQRAKQKASSKQM